MYELRAQHSRKCTRFIRAENAGIFYDDEEHRKDIALMLDVIDDISEECHGIT